MSSTQFANCLTAVPKANSVQSSSVSRKANSKSLSSPLSSIFYTYLSLPLSSAPVYLFLQFNTYYQLSLLRSFLQLWGSTKGLHLELRMVQAPPTLFTFLFPPFFLVSSSYLILYLSSDLSIYQGLGELPRSYNVILISMS